MNNSLTDIKRYFGTDFIIPVGSGTSGLFIILSVLNSNKKRVIIPNLTCPNLLVAINAAGATPLLADVNIKDYNISIQSVKELMDDTVNAVIAVNSFGYPADIENLKNIASKERAIVIEDACQSFGRLSNNEIIGNRGVLGLMSFGYSKFINMGIGGLIITSSKEYYLKIINFIESSSFNNYINLKNKISQKLMLKGHYKTFKVLSKYSNLLNYNFPDEKLKNLNEKWIDFEKESTAVMEDFRLIHALIGQSNHFETFEYRQQDWLPWRYSFKLNKNTDKDFIIKLFQKHEISISNLYPSLKKYCKKKPLINLDNTSDLEDRVLNLKYTINKMDVKSLYDKLKKVILDLN